MIAHLLNRQLSVWRPTLVDDGAGGQTESFAEVGEVWCQVNQPTAAERQVAAQSGVALSHVLHCRAGEDVRRGDELGGDLPSDVEAGRRLRVVSAVSNSRLTYLRLECETVQVQ